MHAVRESWRGWARRASVRSRAGAAVLLVGGLALVAAACQPVTAPPPPQPVAQYCAPSTPVTATDYQSAFDTLRATYTEWASADGAIPVSLPDGRTVWMFGDTFVGHVDPGGAIPPTDPLIHNSFVVQTGPCFQPLMGGAPLARQALIPNPASNEFFWPASAVVSSDGTSLDVFVWHMLATSGGLSFQTLGMEVATFSLPNLRYQTVQPLPFSFDATAMPYGATALANTGPGGDGYVYLYGANKENVYVARALATQNLATTSAWQVYTGADTATPSDPANWSSNSSAAQPTTWLNFTPAPFGAPGLPDEAPFAQPWVLPYKTGGDAFLATAKSADAFSSDVSVFTAPDPWGPFTYQPPPPVTDTPNTSTQVSYGAFSLHPVSANPVIVYSTNVNSLSGAPQPPYSTQEYGPRFVAPENPLP